MKGDSVVDKLLSDLQEKAKELNKIYTALKTIKECGHDIDIPDLSTLISSGGSVSSMSGYKIEPGEFYGKTQTEAAMAFLQKFKKPAQLDSIYLALIAGGIKFKGANGKHALNVQLTRSTGWFAKIPGEETTFGLREWYDKKKSRTMADAAKARAQARIPEEEKDEVVEE